MSTWCSLGWKRCPRPSTFITRHALLRVPGHVILATKVDRLPIGGEFGGEDLHAPVEGLWLQLAGQVDNVRLTVEQSRQPCGILRHPADLQFWEIGPLTPPVVLHPFKANGLPQLPCHIPIGARARWSFLKPF